MRRVGKVDISSAEQDVRIVQVPSKLVAVDGFQFLKGLWIEAERVSHVVAVVVSSPPQRLQNNEPTLGHMGNGSLSIPLRPHP